MNKNNHNKIGMTDYEAQYAFNKDADNHNSIADNFEAKLYSSLLVGAGAALAFILTFQIGGEVSPKIELIRVLSSWLLLGSIGCTFFAGLYFSIHSRSLSDVFSLKGEIQNIKFSNKKELNTIKSTLLASSEISRMSDKERFDLTSNENLLLDHVQDDTRARIENNLSKERNELPKELKKLEKKSNKEIKFTRVLIGFGIVFFILGVLVPLISLTWSTLCG
jgi:hypothetical protein